MKSIYTLRILAMLAICFVITIENTVLANGACDNACFNSLVNCRNTANQDYNRCVNALNPRTTAGINACANLLNQTRQVCNSLANSCLGLCETQEIFLEDARELVREHIECGREGD